MATIWTGESREMVPISTLTKDLDVLTDGQIQVKEVKFGP
jgi:hypothetical protein